MGDSRANRFRSKANDLIINGDIQERVKLLKKLEQSTPDDLAELKPKLDEEIESVTDLKTEWDRAKKYLIWKKAANPDEFRADKDDYYYLALIVYCENNFYKKFNKATRELRQISDVENFPYKHFYKMIFLSITKVVGYPRNIKYNQILYRGVKGHFNIKVGDQIFHQQCLSTSRDRTKARGFAKFDGTAGTLFEIVDIGESMMKTKADLKTEDYPNSSSLDHVNPYAEEEVLIWPLESFKVIDVGDKKNGVRIVKLKA